MEPTLLRGLAAAIMVGAGEIRGCDGLVLWNELIERESWQVGGGQKIPEREEESAESHQFESELRMG